MRALWAFAPLQPGGGPAKLDAAPGAACRKVGFAANFAAWRFIGPGGLHAAGAWERVFTLISAVAAERLADLKKRAAIVGKCLEIAS
jgi:hypothetical protein